MPFQAGNQAAKGNRGPKAFADMLRIALSDAATDKTKLRLVAEALVEKALTGDVPAIKEIADRLDGKAAQAIIGGDDNDEPVKIMLITGVPRDGDPAA